MLLVVIGKIFVFLFEYLLMLLICDCENVYGFRFNFLLNGLKIMFCFVIKSLLFVFVIFDWIVVIDFLIVCVCIFFILFNKWVLVYI